MPEASSNPGRSANIPVKPIYWVQILVGALLLTVAAISWLAAVFSGGSGASSSGGSGAPKLAVIRELPPFTLLDQEGNSVTLDSLKDRAWIANIFFSRCPTICLQLTAQMKRLQESTPAELSLLSITTDPDYDRPEVLERYARQYGADEARWTFLTGERTEIGRLIRDGLMLTAVENPEESRQQPLDLFTHSSYLVLLDDRARVRGIYDALDPDPLPRILADYKRLAADD